MTDKGGLRPVNSNEPAAWMELRVGIDRGDNHGFEGIYCYCQKMTWYRCEGEGGCSSPTQHRVQLRKAKPNFQNGTLFPKTQD